jgi:tRNA (guanine37-N1)-methyltransferase
MTWSATALTLYPEMFPGPLGVSLAGRALEQGIWRLETVQIRDYATDRHRSVDDTPAGGGAGMVMRADVLGAAVDHVLAQRPDAPVVAMTPRGKPLTQDFVRELAAGPGVSILCGRFEGIDERLFEARPIRRRDRRPGPARRLRSAAPRGNGRAFKRSGGKLRERASRISALYPTCRMGRAHDP